MNLAFYFTCVWMMDSSCAVQSVNDFATKPHVTLQHAVCKIRCKEIYFYSIFIPLLSYVLIIVFSASVIRSTIHVFYIPLPCLLSLWQAISFPGLGKICT